MLRRHFKTFDTPHQKYALEEKVEKCKLQSLVRDKEHAFFSEIFQEIFSKRETSTSPEVLKEHEGVISFSIEVNVDLI